MGGGLMSPVHLAFVAVIALIFLGPKKLPELARSLGAGMREFRESMSLEADHDEPPAPLPVAAVADAPPPAAAGVAPPASSPHGPESIHAPEGTPGPEVPAAATAPSPPPAA